MTTIHPLQPLQCPAIAAAQANIRHGFFTRKGGISTGIFDGLNVGIGSDDQQASVGENRLRIARHLARDAADVTTPYQVHSDVAVVVDGPWRGERPKADAVVTSTRNLPIGIVTADCGPVLFADPKAGIIGAAHAGWKGALYGILQKTIETMISIGADRRHIIATLGPMISGDNYEVGPEFREKFLEQSQDHERYFTPSKNTDRFMCHLTDFIVDRLHDSGVKASSLGVCTYAQEHDFFSYRRMTHRGETDYGRQMSAILIQ